MSSHPFEKMFEKAIHESRGDENHVLAEAEKLLDKGYRAKEIYEVLKKLRKSLVQDSDIAIVAEAEEEFSQYIDTGEEEA